jgi:Tfp pilus assembly protein PilO
MTRHIPDTEGKWIKRPVGLILIFLLIILVANTVFSIAVIKSQSEEILSLLNRIGAAREELKRPGRPDAGKGIKKVLTDVETFKARIPDHKGLTGVLNDIFVAARRNGLQIPTGDYNPKTVKETDISKYTIKFPVEGTYPQIKRFIYDIEVMGHLLAIEEIAFSSSKGKRTIGLKITISTYFH